MTRSRRRSATALRAGAIAVGTCAIFAGGAGAAAAAPDDVFAISGDLGSTLYPGGSGSVDLQLTNLTGSDLTVGEITVAVAGVSSPPRQQCLVADFTVTQLDLTHEFTLPPNATRTLSELGVAAADLPRVSMTDTPVNQDGCKNSTVNLAFNGRAGEVLAVGLPIAVPPAEVPPADVSPTVVPPTVVSPADLPSTGASGPPPWAIALAGLGLVGAGAGSVLLTRRRNALPTTTGHARRTN